MLSKKPKREPRSFEKRKEKKKKERNSGVSGAPMREDVE